MIHCGHPSPTLDFLKGQNPTLRFLSEEIFQLKMAEYNSNFENENLFIASEVLSNQETKA